MPDLNIENWKYFKLTDLFDILNGKRLTRANMAFGGKTPYIASIDSNNGLFSCIKQEPIREGNSISVAYNGSIGETFYQPKKFWGTDDINILKPKFKLNSYIGLFLCPIIKQEKYRFNFGRKWNIERMKQTTIKLPVTADGEPDFEFMENYIKSLQAFKKLEELENLQWSIIDNKYELNIKDWQYFKLTDLFNIDNSKKNIQINKIKSGNTPLISSTANNNGIIKYIDETPEFNSNLITIATNGSIGETFYQNKPFCITNDAKVLIPKFNLNIYIALFLINIIKQEKYRYNFGRKWNGNRLTDTQIKLPIAIDGAPNFEFMENYIKSLPYSKSL